MKKVLSFVLAFCMIIPCAIMLSACGVEHFHTYSDTWTFNDTHHWHASTCEHSDEKSGYAEHINQSGVCTVCNHGIAATINGYQYETLQSAIREAQPGQTIVLFDDIDFETAIEITKPVIIDLNGKTLSVSQDIEGNGVFYVTKGGDLTINGDGVVNGVGDNIYNIAIFVEGGELTINGGLYTNEDLTIHPADSDTSHYDLIYVKGGSVVINGGTFKGFTPAWLLNLRDDMRYCSSIKVKGGTFYGFNPENNATEGEGTNYLAPGYFVEENNNVFTVRAGEIVALVGTTEYCDLQTAIDEAEDRATVVLNKDIDLATAVIISKEITINLNNKNLSISQDTVGDGVFKVIAGGDLTIDGEGIVNGVGNNIWNIVIFAYGGNVTINGGTYTNVGATSSTSESGGNTHFDVVYAKTDTQGNAGTVTINGGTFMGQTPEWLLNLHDGSRETSSISVIGGIFKGFNPGDNLAEGEGTNFVHVDSKVIGPYNDYFQVVIK